MFIFELSHWWDRLNKLYTPLSSHFLFCKTEIPVCSQKHMRKHHEPGTEMEAASPVCPVFAGVSRQSPQIAPISTIHGNGSCPRRQDPAGSIVSWLSPIPYALAINRAPHSPSHWLSIVPRKNWGPGNASNMIVPLVAKWRVTWAVTNKAKQFPRRRPFVCVNRDMSKHRHVSVWNSFWSNCWHCLL